MNNQSTKQSTNFESLFIKDQTIKWKFINIARKTRVISREDLYLQDDGVLLYKNIPLTSAKVLITLLAPHTHINQTTSLSNETLLDLLQSLDLFKGVKRSAMLRISHSFVSIIGSLYLIGKGVTEVIPWMIGVSTIVMAILSIVDLCKVRKKFLSTVRKIADSDLDPQIVRGLVEKIIQVTDETPLSTEVPCQHKGEVQILTADQLKELQGKYQLKLHDGDHELFVGKGEFGGCITIFANGNDQEIHYVPHSKNQFDQSFLLSPGFTAIISVIYTLGVAGLTQTGYTSVSNLINLARLKNEMKTTVNDVKDLMKYVASDLCDIDLAGDKAVLKGLNDQIMANQELLETPAVRYAQDPKLYYVLKEAKKTTLEKLSTLSKSREIRPSQQQLSHCLSNTLLALHDKKTAVEKLLRSMDTRQDVQVMFLYGPAGVGKTSLASYIHKEVAKRLGWNSAVYNLNFPNNEHWPSYAGQANATYDEFGARREEDPFLKYLNGVCSTGYFSMNGAEQHEKPQPCAIKHLILIGNAPRWPMLNKFNKDVIAAMWSRMTTYKIEFPKMEGRYETAGRLPDFSHLKITEEVYANDDHAKRPTASACITLQQLIDKQVAGCISHQNAFTKHIAQHAPSENQSVETNHLVINMYGPSGKGKTSTCRNTLGPALKALTGLDYQYICAVADLKNTGKKVYFLDDILTSSATSKTIEKYVEFYSAIPFGSIIVLISNMIPSWTVRCMTNYYIPMPYTLHSLPANYHKNDAVLRRMGLPGWVNGYNGPVYSYSVDSLIRFDGHYTLNKQHRTHNEIAEHIHNLYFNFLSNASDFSIATVDTIREPDDSYVKIVGLSREQLADTISKGGLFLVQRLNKEITIPAHILREFSYTYPVDNFKINDFSDDSLLELGPRLLKIFRRNCPSGEVYVDLGDIKFISQGQLLQVARQGRESITTTVCKVQDRGESLLRVRVGSDTAFREIRYPVAAVHAWYFNKDINAIDPTTFSLDIAVALRRYCEKNPCTFRSLHRAQAWSACQKELAAWHSQLLPSAAKYVSELPVLEILLALCGIALSAWIIARIIKSFTQSVEISDGNQAKAGGIKYDPDKEPDVYNYLRKDAPRDTTISKDTLRFFNLTAYDRDMARWQASDLSNQLLLRPLNNNPPATDIVVEALRKATVLCQYEGFALHGTMTHGKYGVTNAHLFGHVNMTRKRAWARSGKDEKDFVTELESFIFQVEHNGETYNARIIDYIPSHDIMRFMVIEKNMPAFPDIRGYFCSLDDYQNGRSYECALVKNRQQQILDKCTITYELSDHPYWSVESETGVLTSGLSVEFMSSNDPIATKSGDCGSLYIMVGRSHGQKQHALIVGMHVGLRSMEFPYATPIPRELLEGKMSFPDKNQDAQVSYIKMPVPKNEYGIEGEELYDNFIIDVLSRVQPIKDVFKSPVITVVGKDPKQYVEPLKASRRPTGYASIVLTTCKQNSGLTPTTTIGRMDLSECIENDTGRKDILLSQFSPYGDVLPKADPDLMEWCTDMVRTRFQEIYKPVGHPISMKEVFNGFGPGHSRFDTTNKINLESSAGIYFKEKYGVTKKREFFDIKSDGEYVLKNTEAAKDYFSRAMEFKRHILSGKAPATITKVCLKAELRPIEKVKVGKIRTFDSADASLVLAHRMILIGAMSCVQVREARMQSPIQIGIHPLMDFPELYKRLIGKQGKLLQFDFTEFDRHLSFDLIKSAYDIALSINHQDHDHSTAAHALALQTCCGLKMVGNTLVKTFQGISSGFYFTSLGDSIANYLMLLYVVTKVTGKKDMQWFLQNIDAIILGDDISISLTPMAINALDINKVVEAYKELGAKPTSADKTSEIKYESYQDFAFCSRTVRYSRNGIILPPLRMRSILGLLEWVTPSKEFVFVQDGQTLRHSTNMQIVDNINMALDEAAFHPKHQFDKVLLAVKKILGLMRSKHIEESLLGRVDIYSYHDIREATAESIILGKTVLKNLAHTIDLNQIQRMNSISKVEEWCNAHKIAKPTIVIHSPPIEGGASSCVLEFVVDGETKNFSGSGPNMKTSKHDAYDKIVAQCRIVPVQSASLTNFCNLVMRTSSVLKQTYHVEGEWVVEFANIEVLPPRIICSSKSVDLSIATYESMLKLKDIYAHREGVENQMMQSPIAPVHQDTDAGTSLTSAPAQPPPPKVDVTPHVTAPPMDAPMLTTMVGGPQIVVQTPNLLRPADMMGFGGVDFSLKDVAHNQVIDHNPNLAISQGAIRGQVLAVEDYNPFNKNSKIQAWAGAHERYVGDIDIRIHLIANPIFMGEIASCWLPDVRDIRPGDIIPDDVFQLYSWKTMSLRDGGTEFMSLGDARDNKFYRTNNVEEEDKTMTRPGIVIVVYQPMVNPFDNKQAACYLNIGSILSENFRVSNPINTGKRPPPTGDQLPGNNSLEGYTFGTVFSEVGIKDAPEVYMTTDGSFFPPNNATTVTLSTRGIIPSSDILDVGIANHSPTYPGAYIAGRPTEAPTIESLKISASTASMINKPYATDHKALLVIGKVPAQPTGTDAMGSTLSWSMSSPNISGITTLLSTQSYADVVQTIDVSGVVFYHRAALNRTPKAGWAIERGGCRCMVFAFQDAFPSSVFPDWNITLPTTFQITGTFYRYSLRRLPVTNQLLRFTTKVPPVANVGGAGAVPTFSVRDFEARMYSFFNTITMNSGGVVQFLLQDPITTTVEAVVRFDTTTGFVISSPRPDYAVYDGMPVNNLVFRNVVFGNRSIAFPDTDTSRWVSRQVATLRTPKDIGIPVLKQLINAKVVPEKMSEENKIDLIMARLNIFEAGSRYVARDENQASFIGMAAAGAMSGVGGSISNYYNQQFLAGQSALDRAQGWKNLQAALQNKKDLIGEQSRADSQTYANNRMTDMRVRGFMSPTTQLFAPQAITSPSRPFM